MTISWNELAPWVAILLTAANFAYTYFSARSENYSEKFKDIDAKIALKADALHIGTLSAKVELVEDKVIIIQSDLKHLPDKDITHRLELSISEMRTEMRGLAEKMKPIAAIAERVQDAVMEKVMGHE